MDLHLTLTRAFTADYPQEVAAALESRSPEEIAGVLQLLPPDTAAGVIQRMAPSPAAIVTGCLKVEHAVEIIGHLTLDATLPLLRRTTQQVREDIFGAMPKEYARTLKTALSFPPDTAGALMDPQILALPSDLTAEEALKTVRSDAEHAHYNLYVVDRNQVLVGVLNLREMLLASPRERLEGIMNPVRHRLDSDADRHKIIEHPGWREVHSLPVVDRRGRFLGAIRYRTLCRLTDELRGDDFVSGTTTTRALGDLMWTGISGVIEAIVSTVAPNRSEGWRPGSASAAGDTNEQCDSRRDTKGDK